MTVSGLLDGEGEEGVVLVSHFMGFKELRHLYKISKALQGEGVSALRFDFSDCIGESEGKCEDMRLSHQVRDVFSAVDFLERRGVRRIGLMGHSLGGTTAIVAASEDERVSALVVAAGLAKLEWDTVFSERAEEWRRQGYVTFPSWKRGKIKIDYGFYTDLADYDGTDLIAKIDAPVLVIHPADDQLVPLRNSERLFAEANPPKDFRVVQNSDHLFRPEEAEAELVRLATDWFTRWLRPRG